MRNPCRMWEHSLFVTSAFIQWPLSSVPSDVVGHPLVSSRTFSQFRCFLCVRLLLCVRSVSLHSLMCPRCYKLMFNTLCAVLSYFRLRTTTCSFIHIYFCIFRLLHRLLVCSRTSLIASLPFLQLSRPRFLL